MVTGGEAIATAKAIEQIVEIAIKQGWVDRILAAISKQRRIVLLGSSGVGKTNFLNSLRQFPPQAISYLNRTQYATTAPLKLKRRFALVDTPGDITYTHARLDAIRQNISRGKIGVINVVCYGYHEYGAGADIALTATNHPRSAYLERHREIEIQMLKEILPLIGSRETCEFFITLVTKADLWWSQRDAVIPYYTLGSYATELQKFDLPSTITLDYSSVIHRFYGRGSVSGSFDEELRGEKRKQLFTAIADVLSR